jgi:hypothetical protein
MRKNNNQNIMYRVNHIITRTTTENHLESGNNRLSPFGEITIYIYISITSYQQAAVTALSQFYYIIGYILSCKTVFPTSFSRGTFAGA